jgi:hypothetical protein
MSLFCLKPRMYLYHFQIWIHQILLAISEHISNLMVPKYFQILLEITNILSHLISEEEPSASHMCARISSHTYDRRKWVKYHKQYLNVFQSLTTYYTHAGDSKVSNNGKW